MSAKESIRNKVAGIAEQALRTANVKSKELAEIKDLMAKAQMELHAANLRLKHLQTFQPEIHGKLQCPNCWIEREIKSPLQTVASKTGDDSLGCSQCGFEIDVPN